MINRPDIARRRLQTQRLTGEQFASAIDAVGWLGAVQSQDYAGAKWAIGQRTRGATDSELDRLCDSGRVLRTHLMRPTWHFVLPADIRWLLDLTAPRVKALLAPSDRKMGFDSALVSRGYAAMEMMLRGESYRTRAELAAGLDRAGIPVSGQPLGNLVMHAELDGLIVSGPRRGKQVTYALLDERAPVINRIDRDEALAELTRRYFTSHGPAQVQDFAWWSGLTVSDTRRGLAFCAASLRREEIDGKEYWSSSSHGAESGPELSVHLLANYDEFLVAYRDRTAVLDPARGFDIAPFPLGSILAHTVIVNGQVWGGWRRRMSNREAFVDLGPLDTLQPPETAALRQSGDHLARFLGRPVTLNGLPNA